MFLHFGIAHLMNNMVVFCCIGPRLEKAMGHVRFAITYLAAGIGGGLLSFGVMVHTGEYAVSAGASGAIFGMVGALLWMVLLYRGNVEGLTVKGIVVMLFLSLYLGFADRRIGDRLSCGSAFVPQKRRQILIDFVSKRNILIREPVYAAVSG